MKQSSDIWLFVALLLLAVGVRICFSPGLAMSDDFALYHGAINLFHDFSLNTLMQISVGRYALPTALALTFYLAGISEHAILILGLLMSLLTLSLTYLLGRRLLSDSRWVLPALLIVALSPVDINYSVTAFPDSLSNLVVIAGLIVLLKAISASDKAQQFGFYLTYGVIAGLSVPTKESATMLMLLAFPVVTFACLPMQTIKQRLTLCFAGLSGFMVFLLAEMAVNWRVHGDALFRFVSRHAANSQSVANGYRYSGLLDKWQEWIGLTLKENPFDLVLIALALCFMVVYLRKLWKPESPERKFLVIWFVASFLVLLVSSLFTYSFQPRRMTPLIPPAALMLGQGFIFLNGSTRLRSQWRKISAGALALGLCIALVLSFSVLLQGRFQAGLFSRHTFPTYCRYKTQPFRDAAEYLGKLPQTGKRQRVFTDTATISALSVLLPQPVLNRFDFSSLSDQETSQLSKPGAVLIVNDRILRYIAKGHHFSNVIYAPPIWWKVCLFREYPGLDSTLGIYQVTSRTQDIAVREVRVEIPNGDFRSWHINKPNDWKIEPISHPAHLSSRQRGDGLSVDMQETPKPLNLVSAPIALTVLRGDSPNSGRLYLNLRATSTQSQILSAYAIESLPQGKHRKILLQRARIDSPDKLVQSSFVPNPEAMAIELGITVIGKGNLTLAPLTMEYQEIRPL